MGIPRAEQAIEWLVDRVYFKGQSLATITDFPNGLAGYPMSTVGLAIQVANMISVNDIRIITDDFLGSMVIPSCDGYRFKSENGMTNNFISMGNTNNYCTFEELNLQGDQSGDCNIFSDCIFVNGGGSGAFYGTNNIFKRCAFMGQVYLSGGYAKFLNCNFIPSFYFYCGINAGIILVVGGTGYLAIKYNAGEYANTVYVHGFNGEIVVDNSDTAGELVIVGGKVKVTGIANGMTITKYATDPLKSFLAGSNNGDGDIEQNESTGNFNTAQLANFTTLLNSLSTISTSLGGVITDVDAAIASVNAFRANNTGNLRRLMEVLKLQNKGKIMA